MTDDAVNNDAKREPAEGPPDLQTFAQYLDLILKHEDTILGHPEYFLFPVTPSKPLGYLILGWREGVLKESGACTSCEADVLVVDCAGSLLSGSGWWRGICPQCKTEQEGRHGHGYGFRWAFFRDMNQRHPEWEELRQVEDGATFIWGGTGLKPARKERVVHRRTTEPISFEQLIAFLIQQ